jgi:hypothetical protein
VRATAWGNAWGARLGFLPVANLNLVGVRDLNALSMMKMKSVRGEW